MANGLTPNMLGAVGQGVNIAQGIGNIREQQQRQAILGQQAAIAPQVQALRGQLLGGGQVGDMTNQQAFAQLGVIAPQELERTQKLLQDRFKLQSDEEKHQFAMEVMDSIELNNLPTVESKMQFLQTRIAQGGDVQDEMQLMDFLKTGNVEAFDQAVKGVIQMGRDTGAIKWFELEQDRLKQQQEKLQFEKEKEERLAGKLTSFMEKQLDASQTTAMEAGTESRKYMMLADDIFKRQNEVGDIGGGTGSTFSESLKQVTGNTEAVSELRRRFNSVRLSQALVNLPPGPATDKDVEEAFKGVPKENANAETMISFLRGVAKMEYINQRYNELKARHIEKNGNTKGLLDAWKKEAKTLDLSQFDEGSQSSTPQPAPQQVGRFKIEVVD